MMLAKSLTLSNKFSTLGPINAGWLDKRLKSSQRLPRGHPKSLLKVASKWHPFYGCWRYYFVYNYWRSCEMHSTLAKRFLPPLSR